MHSRIFQISKMWIEKENYLNEDTLHQGDGSFYDYCAEIDDEERKEDIRYLVNTALPKDMFELVGDDTIRYIGGVEQWKENFVTNIRKKAEAITTENMLEFVGPAYRGSGCCVLSCRPDPRCEAFFPHLAHKLQSGANLRGPRRAGDSPRPAGHCRALHHAAGREYPDFPQKAALRKRRPRCRFLQYKWLHRR